MAHRVHASPRPASGRRVGNCAAVALAALLQGCSSLSPAYLSNPTPIHPTRVPPGMQPEGMPAEATKAADVVAQRYYASLEVARAPGASQETIDAYVGEGVALINLYCLRWFGLVEEAQRTFQFTDTNRNVITDLGTAAIGIAGLHPDATAVYGALNTAISGFNANFSAAFLVAPNAENVKRLTFEALAARAALLKDTSSSLYPRTFSDAYVQLERLASACTYAEVKRLTTKTVDSTKSEAADRQTGEPILTTTLTMSTATIAQATTLFQRTQAVLSQIDALSGPDALALLRLMPGRSKPEIQALIKRLDPDGRRTTDERAAKAVLKAAAAFTTKSEPEVVEWEQRLNMLKD